MRIPKRPQTAVAVLVSLVTCLGCESDPTATAEQSAVEAEPEAEEDDAAPSDVAPITGIAEPAADFRIIPDAEYAAILQAEADAAQVALASSTAGRLSRMRELANVVALLTPTSVEYLYTDRDGVVALERDLRAGVSYRRTCRITAELTERLWGDLPTTEPAEPVQYSSKCDSSSPPPMRRIVAYLASDDPGLRLVGALIVGSSDDGTEYISLPPEIVALADFLALERAR